jgi:geranylgeranyl transferase type-2 subunit beta
MPTYLEDLTLRLAAAIAELPEDLRARHAKYLLSRQRDDGGFAGREGGSDLYYTSFALRSLAMLGELYGPPAERAAVFLRSRLSGQESIVDFLSLIYGAALIESAAGIDVFAGADPSCGRRRRDSRTRGSSTREIRHMRFNSLPSKRQSISGRS